MFCSHIYNFVRLDVDNSGEITAENLRQVLGDDYSDEKVSEMIREADKKGTGTIDFEEFYNLMLADEDERVSNIAPSGFQRDDADTDIISVPSAQLEHISSTYRLSGHGNASSEGNAQQQGGVPKSDTAQAAVTE